MKRELLTERAFTAWVQWVEDRLVQLGRPPLAGRRAAFQRVDAGQVYAGSLVIGQTVIAEAAPGVLQAHGVLTATGGLGVGTVEAATTLGAVIGRVAILDEEGLVAGYLPVYDTIT